MKTGPKPRDPVERFMSFVSPEPNSGCWLWTGALQGPGYKTDKGYAQFRPKNGGPNMSGHRFAWAIIARKEFTPGLQLDHKCRTRTCVNPDHLEEVTYEENMRRAQPFRAVRTHCAKGHPFDDPYRTKKGTRVCRICNLNAGRKWRQKAKEASHATL